MCLAWRTYLESGLMMSLCWHACRLNLFCEGNGTSVEYRLGRPSLAVRTKSHTRRVLSALDIDDDFLRPRSGALCEEIFERPCLYLLSETSFERDLVRSQRTRIGIS